MAEALMAAAVGYHPAVSQTIGPAFAVQAPSALGLKALRQHGKGLSGTAAAIKERQIFGAIALHWTNALQLGA